MSVKRAVSADSALRDDSDDLVEVVEGDAQAFQYVRAILRSPQFIARPVDNDFTSESDEVVDDLPERQNLRLPVNQRKGVDGKGRAHGGVLIQVVEHNVRRGVTP